MKAKEKNPTKAKQKLRFMCGIKQVSFTTNPQSLRRIAGFYSIIE